jgi:hypothetical protein
MPIREEITIPGLDNYGMDFATSYNPSMAVIWKTPAGI